MLEYAFLSDISFLNDKTKINTTSVTQNVRKPPISRHYFDELSKYLPLRFSDFITFCGFREKQYRTKR